MSIKADLERLTAERADLLAQSQAILTATEDETLTETQETACKDIVARVKEIDAELVALHEKEKEHADMLDSLMALDTNQPTSLIDPARGNHVPAPAGAAPVAFSLPATVRRTNITNFVGEVDGRGPEERAYRFGQWALARATQCLPSQFAFDRAVQFTADNGLDRPVMVHQEGGSDTSGAHVFVPDEFTYDIIKLIDSYGVARQLLNTEFMASDTKVKPKRSGGLTAYAVGESAAGTESDASWTDVRLTARKWMVLTRMSNELSEDSVINMANELTGEVAYAYAVKEDDCVFNGDGSSDYHGIEGIRTQLDTLVAGTAPGLILGAGNAYSELTLANFHSVVAALPQYARGNAKWIVSSTFFYAVMQPLALAAGGTLPGDIANGVAPRFLGYPVSFSETMPSTEANSQICALFGDINLGCLFGDRRLLNIDFSTEASVGGQSMWERDQIGIRATERFDFNCFAFGTASAAGPICGLEMASS